MSVVLATAAPWIVAGVLAALFIVAVAWGFLLLAMGRIWLDLGWGRSTHPLGPLEIRIDAPRELVFEVIAAPYRGRAPSDSGIEILASTDALVVAAHHTKVHFYVARTVEAVELEPPGRVGFRHLTGPVPHAVEEFVLEESDGATELRYRGHMEDVKRLAEQRAAAHRSREARGSAG